MDVGKWEKHLLMKTQGGKETWNSISRYWTLYLLGTPLGTVLEQVIKQTESLCSGARLEEGTDIKQAIKRKICQRGQVLQRCIRRVGMNKGSCKIGWGFNRGTKQLKGDAMPMTGQRSFSTETIACAKALSQEHAYHIQGTKRPVYLTEWGRKKMETNPRMTLDGMKKDRLFFF